MPIHRKKTEKNSSVKELHKRSSRSTVSQATRDKVIEMVISGFQRQEIANALGVSIYQVADISKKEGCTLCRGAIRLLRKQVVSLKGKEYTDKEICRKLNLTSNQLARILFSAEQFGNDILKQNEDVIDYLKKGYISKKVALLTGKSVYIPIYVLHALQVKGVDVYDWREKAVAEMYRNNPNVEAIAEELGLLPGDVFHCLGRSGLVEPMEKPLRGYHDIKDMNVHKSLFAKKVAEQRKKIEKNVVSFAKIDDQDQES